MLMFGGQAPSGAGGMMGGSEGCIYFELTTSGKAWGRGPTDSDIHGTHKRSVDSPAWRHIKMLASLIAEDGNTPKIAGFNDNIEPLTEAEIAGMKQAAEKIDMKVAAENIGVARYISDDPFTMLKMYQLRHQPSTWTASGAATCTPEAPAPSCPTRSPPSTTSATSPT